MTGPARQAEDGHCGRWGCSPPPSLWALASHGKDVRPSHLDTEGRAEASLPSDPPPWPLAPRRTVLPALQPGPARVWAPSSRDVLSLSGPMCPGSRGPTSFAFCPGSETPAVTTHTQELAPPTTDQLVRSTHRAGHWRYPPGHARCPMPAPPPGLSWGVASRCQHSLGQLWAPGSQTWGPTEGR